MTLPVVAIRPEPGLQATIAAGRAAGIEIAGWPLFAIRPTPWEPPPPDSIDALLVGSANAFRHGGPDLARFAAKPAYVVGEATARAAREAGFAVAHIGRGGLQDVLDTLDGQSLRLLRLSGAEHVELSMPDGVSITSRVVYDNVALPMEPPCAAQLRAGAVVLLHSGAAARHFGQECARLGFARNRLRLAALAPRIAEAAGDGWALLRVAGEPTDSALLALARDMCQE